jgi:hypothetical protein
MTRLFTSLNLAFLVFDAHFLSELELTVGILSLLGLLSRRGAFPFACNCDLGRFSVADLYTSLSAALEVFILGAGLFYVDTYISKKVRTAR